jgi:hypothetical protein
MKILKQYDVVALTADLPKENLWSGQVGTVVEVYNDGEAYEVEFVDKDGLTYAAAGKTYAAALRTCKSRRLNY